MSPLKLLYLSYYNLSYGVGASATVVDQLNDLPPNVSAVVIEPNRVDLPTVKVDLSNSVQRIKTRLPLTGALSLLYPFIVFFFVLKKSKKIKPDFIISMHHPFHLLSVSGHVLSKVLGVPVVIDVHDVLRPMGQKTGFSEFFKDALERFMGKVIKKDITLFVCSEHKKILETRAHVKFDNALILPNCVSTNLLKTIKSVHIRDSKIIKFIFVGRIGPEYGINKIEPIIKAAESLGYTPVLTIVGHDQVGVPAYARFLGSLSRQETLNLVNENDVGIGPMNPTMTVPLKVVEYLALGKIVIVGRNAVSRDVTARFKNIIEVSDQDNPSEILQRILFMLDNSKVDPAGTEVLCCNKKMSQIIKKLCEAKNLDFKR
jgi:glycosyltransferase involved in cell wall biosynthesis